MSCFGVPTLATSRQRAEPRVLVLAMGGRTTQESCAVVRYARLMAPRCAPVGIRLSEAVRNSPFRFLPGHGLCKRGRRPAGKDGYRECDASDSRSWPRDATAFV